MANAKTKAPTMSQIARAIGTNDQTLEQSAAEVKRLDELLATLLKPIVAMTDAAAAVKAWDEKAAEFIKEYAKVRDIKADSAERHWQRHYTAALAVFDGKKPQTDEAAKKQADREAKREIADVATLTSSAVAQKDRDDLETRLRKKAKDGDAYAKRVLEQAEPSLSAMKEHAQQTADMLAMYSWTMRFFARTKVAQSAAVKAELEALKKHLQARGVAFAQ